MKLFYRSYGNGKPLIILHGLFGMSDNWTTLAKEFGKNGFAVYAFDIRNHGQSPHSDEFSYELMAEDVVEMMDDLKINTASVIGHSMGAKVAMLLALRHPAKVEKLIAVHLAPRSYPHLHKNILTAMRELGDISAFSSRKEVEQKLSVSISDTATLLFILKNLYWKKTADKEVLSWRLNLSAIEKNIEKIGEAITSQTPFDKPVLFIKGEKSDYINAGDETEIKKLFPQATFQTIAGTGHWVHADKPKEFIEAALSFLN